jgi:hypothetical protein
MELMELGMERTPRDASPRGPGCLVQGPFKDFDVFNVSPEPNRKYVPSMCFMILGSWTPQLPEHGSGSGH